MTRSHRLLFVLLVLPCMAGCFSVAQVPVPSVAADRERLDVRGVVVRRSGGVEEVIRFDEVLASDWTPTSLSIVGSRTDESGRRQGATLMFQLPEISALLVRQLDAGKTSGIVGGVIVGAVAAIALLVTGTQCEGPNAPSGC